jgi:hypothetical protein
LKSHGFELDASVRRRDSAKHQASYARSCTDTQEGEAMYKTAIRHLFVTAAFLTFSMSAGSGEQRGVTDGEIRIGQTMPYSGALSAYSALGKAEIAYFNLVNEGAV